MVNVDHVYSKLASIVLEDVHSKLNTYRMLEFNRSSKRFLVKDMVNLK